MENFISFNFVLGRAKKWHLAEMVQKKVSAVIIPTAQASKEQKLTPNAYLQKCDLRACFSLIPFLH